MRKNIEKTNKRREIDKEVTNKKDVERHVNPGERGSKGKKKRKPKIFLYLNQGRQEATSPKEHEEDQKTRGVFHGRFQDLDEKLCPIHN